MSQNQQLINKLIVSDDNIGRIKYIGELEGQPGKFLHLQEN